MKTTLFQKALALLLCAVLLLTGIPAIGLQAEAATKAKPTAGTAYKMVMNKNGTNLYFNGQTESESVSYRLATTTSLSEAVDVKVEANGSGYALYFMNGSTKTYIRVYERDPSNGKGSLELVTSKPAEVLTYDSAADTLVYTATSSGNAYYMGTYSNYTTFSVSNTSYITGDNAANVDVSQYPARLVKSSSATETPSQPTTPPASAETADKYVTSVKAGTAYKLGMYQGQNKTNLYFNGQTESETVTYRLASGAKSGAVDVYLESASGGYRLYFMDGKTKTYIRVYAYFREGEQYPRGSIELTTEAPQEILTYNSQWNTLVYQYDQDNSFFMGTYSTYTTFSASGTYYITGDNAANIDKTQFPARLYAAGTAATAPTITSHPTTVNMPAGTTAKFTVKASGTGLTYQWQYRTSSTGSWKNCTATGNKKATVSVPVTASRDGFQYRCKVTNSAGKTVNSKVATLNVVTLKITAQPANKTVPIGTTAKFTVKATGSTLKYQWQYRSSSTAAWKSASATGSKTATVKVPATASRNGFQYRCKITDKYGNVIYSKVVTLKAVVLKVTTQPANKTVAAGTTAKFTVKASGTGLTYQWQFRKSADGKWFNNTSASGKTNVLSIGATASRNGFQYRCKITDKYGNVIYSNVATLTVKK
ncbi:MAG: hypothetical protein IJO28_04830 [Oscillospiraceae bacterium]|nr:hypothetical protein [Oscillospiraceae bacterium]